ncbi:MAG: DUF1499 domain-containing protein, partial [Bacteroidota bacterium]
QTDNYILVEFTSRLMGFVDDAEFYFLPDGHTSDQSQEAQDRQKLFHEV